MEKLVMNTCNSLDAGFWRNRRVLVTGHTGFKGSWLVLWLKILGARVTGIALPPATQPSLYELANVSDGIDSYFCDIRDAKSLGNLIERCRPELVFHLAAQPLVRAGYIDPVETFATNIMGTVHLLDALRGQADLRVAIMVTTDKVYKNSGLNYYPFRESDTLGGHDPYSASKAASELVIECFRDAFLANQGVAISSARAGNVIGGGDWSADRLIPDAIRAWQNGKTLEIRSPQSTRPWQHVLEPLYSYLKLAQILWIQPELAGAYNFGPLTHETITVRELIMSAKKIYGIGKVNFRDGSGEPHEAQWLGLEIAKAKAVLGVAPTWNVGQTINQTISWYLAQQRGVDARNLCLHQINDYQVRCESV